MASGVDPLSSAERAAALARPRPHRALTLVKEGRDLHLEPPRASDAQHRPIYCVWEITLKCDLACRHCGSRAGHSRPQELSTAECLDLVHQMAEFGVREVTLIGGEAYLRDDWLDIAREIRRLGLRCTMTTGGRGLDAVRALRAREAGIQGVSVSIDGLAETHDRLRGVNGSHAAALGALAHLRSAGFPLLVNTQINRLSMPELPELFDRLVAEGVRHWQIQLTVPMGRAADEPEVLLQPYDLLALFPMLATLKQRGMESNLMMQPGNNVGYFGPYESILRSHLRCNYSSGCGAGRITLGIEADGAIKGCPSLPSAAWTGGNIRQASLKDIWERTAPLRYTRDRSVDDLWGFCKSCYYAETCMAGCTWTGHVFFDKPGNNPYCHHRALEMQRIGKRERLVRVHDAAGRPFDNGRFDIVVEPAESDANDTESAS